ncbi:DUF2569 family protein [Photorhabdus antumapuensis]|uniref:DUF2569 family protein n=1 Tax=Photorhabdus antumapuensis TaxID=2862867 RepID=UPI001CED17AB|nr:DUF2569 domain-containing protein [Photorhabdus antumapuensis]
MFYHYFWSCTLYICSFLSKKEKTPLFYIILLVFTSLFVIADLALAHYVYEIKQDYNYLFLLFRTVFYACIWVPCFIVSIRIKRTFIK